MPGLVPFLGGNGDLMTFILIFFTGCLGDWGRVLISSVALFLTIAFVQALFSGGKFLK